MSSEFNVAGDSSEEPQTTIMKSLVTRESIVTHDLYEGLDLTSPTSFRLLELQLEGGSLEASTEPYDRFDGQDVVKCFMRTFDLNDEPKYDAMSYTWGNPLSVFHSKAEAEHQDAVYAKRVPMICNDLTFLVSANLYDLLFHIRKIRRNVESDDSYPPHNLSQYFWVDAICINQNNVVERNAQVAVMHKIYQIAREVIIWLGVADHFARAGMTLVCKLSELTTDGASTLLFKQRARVGLSDITDEEWCCLYALFHRNYFKRTWVVQEIVLSRHATILCGFLQIPWSYLARATMFLTLAKWWPSIDAIADARIQGMTSSRLLSLFQKADASRATLYRATTHLMDFPNMNIFHILDVRAGLGYSDDSIRSSGAALNVDLLAILSRFRSTACYEPRDKIFALMSFAAKGNDSDFVITANYNLPVDKVHLQTAWMLLSSSTGLRCLAYVFESSSSVSKSIPSWVPDWSSPAISNSMDEDFVYTSSGQIQKIWNSCAHHRWSCPAKLLDPLLVVEGQRIGTVKQTARLKDNNLQLVLRPYFDLPLVSMMDVSRLSKNDAWENNTVSWQTRFEVLWRTLIHDRFNAQHPAPAEVGHAFVRSLKSDIKRVFYATAFTMPNLSDLYSDVDKSEIGFTVNETGVTEKELVDEQSERLTIMNYFSEDELRCLEAYDSYMETVEEQDFLQFHQAGLRRPVKYLPIFETASDILDEDSNADDSVGQGDADTIADAEDNNSGREDDHDDAHADDDSGHDNDHGPADNDRSNRNDVENSEGIKEERYYNTEEQSESNSKSIGGPLVGAKDKNDHEHIQEGQDIKSNEEIKGDRARYEENRESEESMQSKGDAEVNDETDDERALQGKAHSQSQGDAEKEQDVAVLRKAPKDKQHEKRSEFYNADAWNSRVGQVNFRYGRLFSIDNDTLGNGPDTTQSGDQIWVLAGGNVPYVLRPLENGNYKFIGGTYVHGIMHGEAMKTVPREELTQIKLE